MDNVQESRKQELELELGQIDLTLRYDSKLCYCFVNGETGPEWTAKKVAYECGLMHWFHTCTDYEGRCQFASINESRMYYFHNKKHFTDYMRKYIYPIVKETIIKEHGGIPSTWPWLNNEVVNQIIPQEEEALEVTS